MELDPHKLVFVGGLHRSGTTLLARLLAEHPAVSGFRGTGVKADEGQFLQSVYPDDHALGGPGRFAFHPDAHLTETSPLVSEENRDHLLRFWEPYWDLDQPVLVEKTPGNLMRMRFLHALFPGSRFVMIVRHPIAVAYATKKWSWTSARSLMRHWRIAHQWFLADARQIPKLTLVRYEDLVIDPGRELARVFSFLGLDPIEVTEAVQPAVNEAYFGSWGSDPRVDWFDRVFIATRYRHLLRRFGYDLAEPVPRGRPSRRVSSYLSYAP